MVGPIRRQGLLCCQKTGYPERNVLKRFFYQEEIQFVPIQTSRLHYTKIVNNDSEGRGWGYTTMEILLLMETFKQR